MTIKHCAFADCTKPRKSHGLCNSHNEQRRLGKSLRPLKMAPGTAEAWVNALLSAPPTNECVEWPFAIGPEGYGRWKAKLAHRRILIAHTGQDDSSMQALHRPGVCHNRACVNPRHLYWGDRHQNMADKLIDDTHNRGVRHPMSKLTEADVHAIRRSTGSPVDVGQAFSVSRQTVRDIRSRRSWAWLPEEQETA